MALYHNWGIGGIRVSGTPTLWPIQEIGSGGVVVSGNPKVTPFIDVASSGVIVNGSAHVSPHNNSASGGAACRGTALVQLVGEHPIRIHYVADDLESGLDIRFTIWTGSGIKVTNDYQADEISSTGVYFVDFASQQNNQYLLVKTTGDEYPYYRVVKLGSPNGKIFYIDNNFQSGLTLAYTVFDLSCVEELSGDLTNVTGGFYFADISSLDMSEVHFFEVEDTHIAKFGGESTQITITGGAIVSGTAYATTENYETTSGGAIVSGTASVSLDVNVIVPPTSPLPQKSPGVDLAGTFAIVAALPRKKRKKRIKVKMLVNTWGTFDRSEIEQDTGEIEDIDISIKLNKLVLVSNENSPKVNFSKFVKV